MDRDVERRLLELAAEIASLKKVVGTHIAWCGSAANSSLSRREVEVLLTELAAREKGGSG